MGSQNMDLSQDVVCSLQKLNLELLKMRVITLPISELSDFKNYFWSVELLGVSCKEKIRSKI